MLRIIVAIVLSLYAYSSIAACSETISAQTNKTDIFISDGQCDHEFRITYLVKKSNSNKAHSSYVSFDDECSYYPKDALNPLGFRCNKNGVSPLKGATYRLTHDSPISECEEIKHWPRYTCVKGCEGLAPKYLKIEPYEC